MILTDMLKRLTDNYAKEPNSKVGKLLNIVALELTDLQQAIDRTGEWREIDTAQGATLDRIGQNVQQLRGQATDDVYKILIKSKIARNLSDGSINTLIKVLSITLNTAEENVVIRELYNDLTNPEPAAVYVNAPTESLNAAGFSLTQFGRLVNQIVAAGIRANVLFQGTFSFSSQLHVSETDANAGFADNDQLTGGTLGGVYDPANDPDLPI